MESPSVQSAAGGVVEPLTGAVTPVEGVAVTRQGAGVIVSWALFDFARTIFSYSILSVNFSLWVTQDHHAPVIAYTLAASVSLAIIAVASPALGVISDRAGRRLPFLAAVTVLMVAATALLSVTSSLLLGLVLFVVANVGYQSTQVFYDALLGSITTPRNRGRISGLGMAFGYLGTIAWGIFALLYLSHSISRTHHTPAFLPTAIAVALFALPCFLAVKERRPPHSARITSADLRAALTQTRRSVGKVWREHRNLARFLLARLLYADAANTVVSFMAVYSVVVAGLTDKELNIFLPSAATFAVAGALIFGRLADRFGPKRMLNVILALWFVAMTWAALVPSGTVHLGSLALSGKALFYAVGPLAGLALGGTRACDRAFLVRATPLPMIGEAFGLFSLVGDVSSIVGPMLLGLVTFLFLSLGHEVLGYRAAILAIVVLLCIGWYLLQRASDAVPAAATTPTATS
jgi:UMF1 family MFS transporter